MQTKQSGWIYALTNRSLNGLYKVGMTSKTPEDRAAELSAATASPTPFFVVYAKETDDIRTAENDVHNILSDFRVSDNREFFKTSLFEVVKAIDYVCGGFSELDPPTPFAELFATFPDDGEARELTAEEQRKCKELFRQIS